jgi:CubicO group peptidase (beta-lactamase class C family)
MQSNKQHRFYLIWMKRITKYSLLGLAFWFLIFLGWEWWRSFPKVRVPPVSFPESREARIDSLLSQSLIQYLMPGIAVGIITNEKLTYLKAFGFENLKTKDTLTVQSHIPVASVSKIFTALTLANFALEKGYTPDSSVNSILPDAKKLSPDFSEISLLDLLNHTSGISDKRGFGSILLSQEKRQLDNLPKLLNSPKLESKGYHYADTNFDLIGYLLETCDASPFELVAKVRTLIPGGMNTSEYAVKWPPDTGSVQGHQRTFLWKRIEQKALKLERFPSPSSGLVLTPTELSNALIHLSRGAMGTFGDELAWLKNGGETPAGFQSIQINNSRFIGHFGEQGGYSALVIYSPELEVALFLVSNTSDNTDFRRAIAAGILKLITP